MKSAGLIRQKAKRTTLRACLTAARPAMPGTRARFRVIHHTGISARAAAPVFPPAPAADSPPANLKNLEKPRIPAKPIPNGPSRICQRGSG